jgi:hypothetical protein
VEAGIRVAVWLSRKISPGRPATVKSSSSIVPRPSSSFLGAAKCNGDGSSSFLGAAKSGGKAVLANQNGLEGAAHCQFMLVFVACHKQIRGDLLQKCDV